MSCQYAFQKLCNTFHSKNLKHTIYKIDYRRDVSFWMRVFKEMINKKTGKKKM